jgi:hypothetical protein
MEKRMGRRQKASARGSGVICLYSTWRAVTMEVAAAMIRRID